MSQPTSQQNLRQQFRKLMAKINNGQELSNEELKRFEGMLLDAEDPDSAMSLLSYFTDPEIVGRVQDKKSAERLRKMTGAISKGYDFVLANQQVRQAKKAMQQQAPTAPALRGEDPYLAAEMRRLDEARSYQGLSGDEARMQGRMQNLYNTDEYNARVGSGGNAAAYAAAQQQAMRNRYDAERGYAQDRLERQDGLSQQYNDLLRQRAYQQRFQDQTRENRYLNQVDNYRNDMANAGALMATGMRNRRQSVHGMMSNAADIYGMFNKNPMSTDDGISPGVVRPKMNPGIQLMQDAPIQFNKEDIGTEVDYYEQMLNESIRNQYRPQIA